MKRFYALYLALFISASLLNAQNLISVTYKGGRTKAQMVADFGIFMQYGVDMYKFQYATPDVQGQPDTASGLFVLPRVDGASLPLLVYQHGTVGSKSDVPSNLAGGYELAMVYGAMGYATLAPDYLGLGDARGFHPYLHAATEASAAIDMLIAAREFLENDEDFEHNGLLFLTGYSQGGHASAALHRELEANYAGEWPVTAAAHMSGPYRLSGTIQEFANNEEEYSIPAYVPYIILGLNEAYQLYTDFSQVFREPYLGPILDFYAGEIDLGALNQDLITFLTAEAGGAIPKYMLQDSLRQAIAADPGHPLNLAIADNDVYDWAPQAPTRLYYCTADEQVPYTNSLVADSVMNANGAPNVLSVDANPVADHFNCVEPAVTRAIFFFGPMQDLTVASEEVSAPAPARLHPNPASAAFWVEGLQPGDELFLRSATGQLLEHRRSTGERAEWPLKGYAPGIYWLQVLGGKGVSVLKVVVE